MLTAIPRAFTSRNSRPAKVAPRAKRGLRLESLEAREVPAVSLFNNGLSIADNGAVSGQFNVAGATVKATNLHGNVTTHHVEITGDATVTLVNGNSFAVHLGSGEHGGLEYNRDTSKLESLDLAISGAFRLDGMIFSADHLGASWTAAKNGSPEELDIAGGLDFKIGEKAVSLKLGDNGTNGVVLSGGALKSLDAAVGGEFGLFGVKVEADDLRARYDAAAHSLKLTGGLKIDFAPSFTASAAIDGGGLMIDTKTGTLSINAAEGLELSASMQIGKYGLAADVRYAMNHGKVDLAIDGSLDLGKFKVDAHLEVASGQLKAIGLSYDGEGIALGESGLILTAASGSVDGINDPTHIDITLSATVESVAHVKILGTDYALISATGSIHVSPASMSIGGKVHLANDLLGSGTAGVALDWAKGVYTVTGTVGMYDNTFSYGGTVTVTSRGDLTIDGYAGVNLPSSMPAAIHEAITAFTGSDSLGQVQVHLEVHPGDAGKSYGAMSIMAGGKAVIGFQVDGYKHFTLTGQGGAEVAKGLQALHKGAEVIAGVLKDAYHFAADQVAALLKDFGYAAETIGRVARNVYHLAVAEATQLLTDIGCAAGEVAVALGRVYQRTEQQVAQLLKNVGWAAEAVGRALQSAYSETADAAIRIMRDVGYEAKQLANTLKNVFGALDSDTGRVLKQVGCSLDEVAGAVKGVYNSAKTDLVDLLTKLGYGADDVWNAVKRLFS